VKARNWIDVVRPKVRAPLAVALGGSRTVADLLAGLKLSDALCYQMDLYQAEQLRAELDAQRVSAQVQAAADLWDLPGTFQTVLFPTREHDERHLKIDMVEQAFHLLRPHGTLVVVSRYEKDLLFPGLLKKVFGDVHASPIEGGTVLWATRTGARPRRRHEVTFQARIREGPSLRFLSRPGVFSFGRLDEGARALLETMLIQPGDRILDIGCGCGTNGIVAGLEAGQEGSVTFVDSNLRAVVLAEHNARANGLTRFEMVASSRLEELPGGSFDGVLANPPYYANAAIARLFVERSRDLLRKDGRLYLVTKQEEQLASILLDCFPRRDAVEAASQRGYTVFCVRT
jgi:16S rRNA (guanine1207-N2)-methyltransferase